MKRYLILMAILFALPACGGNGGDDNSFTESTPTTSSQLGASGGEANPSVASHEAAFGDTAPVLGKGSSNRFDENGNLIGIVASPYMYDHRDNTK